MKTEQREEGTAAFSTAPAIVATMAWFSTYLGAHIGMRPKRIWHRRAKTQTADAGFLGAFMI